MASLRMDTYQRYKAGEHIFIRWLVDSARKCGDISHLLPNSKQHLGASTIHISASNLLRLVEVMLKAEIAFEVPKDIMLLITDVIRLRKEQATFYLLSNSSQGAATMAKDDGHGHFIGVLEKIAESLRRLPGYTPPVKEDPSGTSHSQDEIDCPMENISSRLTVEETVEWTSTPVRPPDNARTIVTETEYAFEDRDPRYEGHLASFCYWQDAYKMRLYLRSQWEAYANDEISLISVAYATNAAFRLSRVANKKISTAFPCLVGTPLAHTLQTVLPLENTAEQIDGLAEAESVAGISPELRTKMPDILCVESLYLLRRYHNTMEARLVDPGFQPELSEPEMFFLKRAGSRVTTNALEVIIDSASRLAEERASTAWTVCGDQLLLNLTNYPTKAQPYSNGFACHVAMDIHRTLAKSRYKALNDVRKIAASVANVIRHFWSVYARLTQASEEFVRVQYRLLYVAGFINEWIANDAITKHATVSRPRHIRRSPFDLLIAHPTLCGLIADTLLSRVHECGLHLCETEGLLLPIAHFYNAALQTSSIKHRWLEMDELISIQTPQHIFIGDTPTSIERIYKHLALALGQSLSSFASDNDRRANSGLARFTKQRRPLRKTLVLLGAAQELRAQKRADGCGYYLMDHVDYLISACMTSLEKTPGKRNSTDIQDIIKQWQATRNLDQLQALRMLLFTKDYEVSSMSFDYLTLSLRCQIIMRKLSQVIKDHLGDFPYHASMVVPELITSMSSSDPTLFKEATSALDSYLHDIEPVMGNSVPKRQDTRDDNRPLPLNADLYMKDDDLPPHLRPAWKLLYPTEKSAMHSACVLINGISVSLHEPEITEAKPRNPSTQGQGQGGSTRASTRNDADTEKHYDNKTAKPNLSGQTSGESFVFLDETEEKKPKKKRIAGMKAGRRR
ncbi:hypothetical protein BDV97DRAFT_188008 [Delphinella strobiligena]|nr:hypothetical protein BDV97DRAFT_188008 [Delphinella strobiligena]